MPADRAIRIEGLKQLQRAFARADREMQRKFKDALRDAVEPVRSDAESLAVSQIPRVGFEWSRMRVGVTQRSVYVAPRKRGVSRGSPRSRPKFAPILLAPMEEALERNEAAVRRQVDHALDEMERSWSR